MDSVDALDYGAWYGLLESFDEHNVRHYQPHEGEWRLWPEGYVPPRIATEAPDDPGDAPNPERAEFSRRPCPLKLCEPAMPDERYDLDPLPELRRWAAFPYEVDEPPPRRYPRSKPLVSWFHERLVDFVLKRGSVLQAAPELGLKPRDLADAYDNVRCSARNLALLEDRLPKGSP